MTILKRKKYSSKNGQVCGSSTESQRHGEDGQTSWRRSGKCGIYGSDSFPYVYNSGHDVTIDERLVPFRGN